MKHNATKKDELQSIELKRRTWIEICVMRRGKEIQRGILLSLNTNSKYKLIQELAFN